MQPPVYDLPISHDQSRRVIAAWIILGLLSLVAAGVFSLLLVLARTPVIQSLIPFADFFRVALVVHVNLSVLVWLLSITAALWSLSSRGERKYWDWSSFSLAAVGAAVMVLAPFAGAGNPQMSNYVPVLDHPLFFAGLGLFVAGIAIHLLRAIVTRPKIGDSLSGQEALSAGITFSAVIVAAAFLSTWASYLGVPADMSGQIYFEFLFWGGGHVIQFGYTLLMMIAWVVLASASGCRVELTPRLLLVYLLFICLPIITVPFLYVAHDVVSAGHRLAFTELMKYGGLSCLPLGLAVLSALWRAQPIAGEGLYLRSTLNSSVVLFTAGGVLGFLIAGLDIVIPAHYHGTTVGVTVAFMGLCYFLLPRLGFGPIPERMAFWQPYLYGGGQLLHIAGLAWTGGYGMQRKTAGAAQGIDRASEVAGMGLMGLGGLISVIGGVLFLIVCYKSIRARSSS
ncbi:MAG: cbb3-type cytochrome c oxidase subunit I [Proteobacteria bacterium]|nr:cbb3-type cytochrome c oxidase subunit I [Pseudomonadota bacterium]